MIEGADAGEDHCVLDPPSGSPTGVLHSMLAPTEQEQVWFRSKGGLYFLI